MADFEAEVRQGLGRLQAQARALGNTFKELQGKASAAFDGAVDRIRKTGTALRSTQSELDKTGKQTAQLGSALGRLGGPIGESLSRVLGGAGMAGGMGKVAIAAGIAAIAMKGLTWYIGDQREKALATAKALGAMDKAARDSAKGVADAQNARMSSAAGAAGSADFTREATRMIGKDGIEMAGEQADRLGLDVESVIRGNVMAANMPHEQRARAMDVAGTLAQANFGSYDAIMERMTTDTRFGAAVRGGRDMEVLGALYTGDLTPAGRERAQTQIAQADQARMSGDTEGMDRATRAQNRGRLKSLSDLTSGRTADALEELQRQDATAVAQAAMQPYADRLAQLKEEEMALAKEREEVLKSWFQRFGEGWQIMIGSSRSYDNRMKRIRNEADDAATGVAKAAQPFIGTSGGTR